MEVVGGVWKFLVMCGSRRWCVKVVGCVWKSEVLCGSHK